MGRDDLEMVRVACDGIVKETAAAVLLEIDEERHWIPWSLIGDHDEEWREFTIPRWFVEEKGLENYLIE